MLQNPHVLLTFDKVLNPLRLPREATSEPPKVVRAWCVLYILTSKCASRHNGVHFFDIATFRAWCVLYILTSKCASRHNGVHFFDIATFRAWCVLYILTSTCASRHNGVHFFDISTSKSGPALVCLCILTSKCASGHNGVQFFISHLASWLRTRRFSEPTFRPSGATTVFRDFPTVSRICIFFLLTLSLLLFSLLIFLFSLPLPYSAFHLSILSEV